jgi:hypothetical protein
LSSRRVPATPADAHGGGDALEHRGSRSQQREQRRGVLGRVVADDDRMVGERAPGSVPADLLMPSESITA